MCNVLRNAEYERCALNELHSVVNILSVEVFSIVEQVHVSCWLAGQSYEEIKMMEEPICPGKADFHKNLQDTVG